MWVEMTQNRNKLRCMMIGKCRSDMKKISSFQKLKKMTSEKKNRVENRGCHICQSFRMKIHLETIN